LRKEKLADEVAYGIQKEGRLCDMSGTKKKGTIEVHNHYIFSTTIPSKRERKNFC